MNHFQVRHLSFSYGRSTILDDVSFELPKGEFLTILGKSGSGKTTLLRVCAGFETPSSGSVHFDGTAIDRKNQRNSRSELGFVFQDYALFEQISVEKNVYYGCVNDEDRRRAQELVDLLGIGSLLKRRPCDLSGGERQRVALARALALGPQLLFMDEPFASIDRKQTRRWISEFRKLFKSLGVTVIMVTHSLEEAVHFSDQILFMEAGKVVQQGTVMEFYQNPSDPAVRDFFGQALWVPGTIEDGQFVSEAGNFLVENPETLAGKARLFVPVPERPIFKKGT